MREVETILKMIETVDPADTAKLDEIDARVWCYLEGATFGKTAQHGGQVWCLKDGPGFPDGGKWYDMDHHYIDKDAWDHGRVNHHFTRSRDALKAIRSEGWIVGICLKIKPKGYCAGLYKISGKTDIAIEQLESLPTEELAELHAIIQAIEYDRQHAQATS